VNFELRPTVTYYLTDFYKFAPFYTVVAIIIFVLFKLYGGMWRYAGINDMNRIIGANAVTLLLQILGTVFFVCRMPITYYVIGAILQFFFITIIRFAYRILLVEKKKAAARKSTATPAVIIGAGETGRKAINHLEDNGEYTSDGGEKKDGGKCRNLQYRNYENEHHGDQKQGTHVRIVLNDSVLKLLGNGGIIVGGFFETEYSIKNDGNHKAGECGGDHSAYVVEKSGLS
jgi:hypothetical protein